MIDSYPDGACFLQCLTAHLHGSCTNDLVKQTAEIFRAHLVVRFEEIYENESFPKSVNIGARQKDIQNMSEMRKVVSSPEFHLLWLDHIEIFQIALCFNIKNP